MSHPIDVSDGTFEQEILKSDKPVLVDFWAPWCAPCRIVSPVVEELADDYEGRIKVAKVNTDENQMNANTLQIRGIPTLIMFKGGKEVDRLVGAVPKPHIAAMVERSLG